MNVQAIKALIETPGAILFAGARPITTGKVEGRML